MPVYLCTSELPTVTDNQAVRHVVVSKLDALRKELFVKNACFAACASGFSAQTYTRAKVEADLDFTRSSDNERASQKNRVPKDVLHPKLYKRLLEWREETATEQNVLPWEVLTNTSMKQLVAVLPTNNRHLFCIKGIGKGKGKRYGDAILKIVENYSREENVSANVDKGAVVPKSILLDTKYISLKMFEAGISIEEIARLRSLARTTIQGHLAIHVVEGRLDVACVLAPEKISDITEFFTRNPTATVAEAKAYFGEKYSYGELKMIAWRFRLP